AWRVHVTGHVFGPCLDVGDRLFRVVHACDGDAHRGDARVGLAVIGLVGEAVGAVVVGRRDVAEAAVAVQCQAAVCGLAHQHRAQGVAVHVAVVDQHAGRSEAHTSVL